MAEHTPTPWRIDPKRSLRIVAGDDDTVATVGSQTSLRDDWEENALLIVNAVNSHKEMAKRLEPFAKLAGLFDDYERDIREREAESVLIKVRLSDLRDARRILNAVKSSSRDNEGARQDG